MASPIVIQSVCSSKFLGSATPKPNSSVYEIITNRILAELEKGVVPWRKPWQALPPVNLISQKPYRGINVFLLSLPGYGSAYWLTYKQTQMLGGQIRRGEHGAKIIFWKCAAYETETPTGQTDERRSAVLRYYTVFNLEQTDGLKANAKFPSANPIESADSIIEAMPNPPAFKQDHHAAYIPSNDTVTMPSRNGFDSREAYYSTFFHELIHSTGHSSRLNRDGINTPQKFGSESYSREELIAEMGSAMLCGLAGIEQQTLKNSVAYLKSWIDQLRSDSRLVISAASAAQKAADYIRGLSNLEKPESVR